MRYSKLRFIALVASLVVAAPASAWGTSPASADPPSRAPIAVSGEVPSGATEVRLAVLPPLGTTQGAKYRYLSLPATTTSITGDRFSASVEPASIPASYVQPDGIVDFKVSFVGGGKAWETNVSARMVTGLAKEGPSWVDPVESASHVDRGRTYLRSSRGVIAIPRLNSVAAGELEDDGVNTNDFARVSAPSDVGCYDTPTGGDTEVPTTIGTTYPVGYDTARMVVSSSQGGSYGIATSASGRKGTFEAGGTKFKRSSWGQTWRWTGEQRAYRLGVEYREYATKCGLYATTIGYKWVPVGETGGTSSADGLSRPSWNIWCSNVVPGTWYRDKTDGHAYSFGTGVKFGSVIGIDLSVKHDYATEQHLEYDIKKDNKRMCGNDTYAARAGKVIERFQ